MRVTPLVWISFGLVGLTISIMMAGDVFVDLVPNRDRQVFEYRRDLAESLAIQYSALAERDQIETVKFAMETLVKRIPDILSLALLHENGIVVAQIGDHAGVWVQPPGKESTLEFLQVPIFSGDQRWGVLQIAFRQVNVSGLQWFLTDPWVRFLAFVSVSGFVGYLLFMKRTLRQLDPSGIVPTRVKSALDALTQGVVMIDTRDLIVLANDTFCQAVGKPVTSLIGSDLSTGQRQSWKSSPKQTGLFFLGFLMVDRESSSLIPCRLWTTRPRLEGLWSPSTMSPNSIERILPSGKRTASWSCPASKFWRRTRNLKRQIRASMSR
jgi:PAS domain-containing protein